MARDGEKRAVACEKKNGVRWQYVSSAAFSTPTSLVSVTGRLIFEKHAEKLDRLPLSSRGTVAYEHDLADHASVPEQLLCASCLGKRKSLRDERVDLLLLKEVEQGD
jgi:hypothetical protein